VTPIAVFVNEIKKKRKISDSEKATKKRCYEPPAASTGAVETTQETFRTETQNGIRAPVPKSGKPAQETRKNDERTDGVFQQGGKTEYTVWLIVPTIERKRPPHASP
jgi:hypothetical protein